MNENILTSVNKFTTMFIKNILWKYLIKDVMCVCRLEIVNYISLIIIYHATISVGT